MTRLAHIALAVALGCGSPSETPPRAGAVAAHDHSAHHGGVVTMVGELHLEAVGRSDGLLRVYVTDLRRQPVPLAGVTGSVTLALGGRSLALALAPGDGALEARGPELPVGDVRTRVDVKRAGRDFTAHLVVPVGISPGLAGLPRTCDPVVDSPPAAHSPRCVVRFPRMVRALAATPDGRTLLVAVFGHGVTIWQLPAAEAAGALEPPPGSDAHPDHAHPVDRLAVRSDGREVAVAVRNEIARYALPDGRLVHRLPRDYHLVEALAYTDDGTRLLASALFDGAAEMLAVDGGTDGPRLRVDRPLSAAAFAADGRMAVLASELGPLSLFHVPAPARVRVLPASAPARALAVAGKRVLAATDDGTIRAWSAATGRALWRTSPGPGILVLAVRPDGRLVASGHHDGTVRLFDAETGRLARTLGGHAAPVQALAWVGEQLASGDTAGLLALWDPGTGAEILYNPGARGLGSRPGR